MRKFESFFDPVGRGRGNSAEQIKWKEEQAQIYREALVRNF